LSEIVCNPAEIGDDSTDEVGAKPVDFLHFDILSDDLDKVLGKREQRDGWDVVLDKGTFDAVSLMDAIDFQGQRGTEFYRDRVLQLVKPGGLFLITSCNWTEEELEHWFLGAGERDDPWAELTGSAKFVVDGRVNYRSMSFGGAKGQAISTACFRKVAAK